jgi:hypothetical protein
MAGVVDEIVGLPEVLVGFSVSRQGAAALNRLREKVHEQTGLDRLHSEFLPVRGWQGVVF